jgi:CRISPR-associated protein Cst2
MSKHIFGLVATPYGIAANNRGETDGNITTLQKLLWNGEVHTTVSAEAIRWAIRYYWQRRGLPVNREWLEDDNDHKWNDPRWLAWTDPNGKGKGVARRIDDDALGYMVAEAAKDDGSDAPGSAIKRRGPLEVTRAISLTPFAGDITFNAKSGTKGNTSLYGTEVHATRYQYGFGLTPGHLNTPAHALEVVGAITGLSEVAGNQSRFLFDFSPEAVILRWTDDFAPRMLYGFEMDEKGRLRLPAILGRLDVGDIDPAELVVGVGRPDLLDDSVRSALAGHGIEPVGVRQAADEMRRRMATDLGIGE